MGRRLRRRKKHQEEEKKRCDAFPGGNITTRDLIRTDWERLLCRLQSKPTTMKTRGSRIIDQGESGMSTDLADRSGCDLVKAVP